MKNWIILVILTRLKIIKNYRIFNNSKVTSILRSKKFEPKEIISKTAIIISSCLKVTQLKVIPLEIKIQKKILNISKSFKISNNNNKPIVKWIINLKIIFKNIKNNKHKWNSIKYSQNQKIINNKLNKLTKI